MQYEMRFVHKPFPRKIHQITALRGKKEKVKKVRRYFWDPISAEKLLIKMVHDNRVYDTSCDMYISFDELIVDILTEHYSSGGKIPHEWLANRILYPVTFHTSRMVTYPSLDDYDAMEHPKGYGGDDA